MWNFSPATTPAFTIKYRGGNKIENVGEIGNET
jgi:hypothetical protein